MCGCDYPSTSNHNVLSLYVPKHDLWCVECSGSPREHSNSFKVTRQPPDSDDLTIRKKSPAGMNKKTCLYLKTLNASDLSPNAVNARDYNVNCLN